MIIDTSFVNITHVSTCTLPSKTELEVQSTQDNLFIDQKILTAVDIGLELISIGLNVIPLDANLNAPVWVFKNLCSSTTLSDMSWIRIMRDYDNVGVITGKKSQNLFVVRCKTQKAYEDLEAHLGTKMDWVSKTGDCWDTWFFCDLGFVSNRKYSQGMKILGHEKVVEYPGCRSLNGVTSEWVRKVCWHPHILDADDMEEFFPNIIITPMRNLNDNAHSIEKYKQAVSIINDPEELSDIDKAYAFSETFNFGKGLSGAGKQSVYRALIERGKQESTNNFRASLRELEAMSTPRIKTISKYLKEFERKGLIELLSTSPMGTRYRLTNNKFCHIKRLPKNVVNLSNLPVHDIWTSRSGLGACTKNIVEFLIAKDSQNELFTAKDISNRTNVSYATVCKRLKQLRELELVVKNGMCWKIDLKNINPSNFDTIAKKLRVDGKYNARKKQASFDRQKWCVYLAKIYMQQVRN